MKEFEFNHAKAFQAIRWILNHEDRAAKAKGGIRPKDIVGAARSIDMNRAFFLADRKVINLIGRPIFGGRWSALARGPVHAEIYRMMEGWRDMLETPEQRKRFGSVEMREFPWSMKGDNVVMAPEGRLDEYPDDRENGCRNLSEKEMDIIMAQYAKMKERSSWKWRDIMENHLWDYRNGRETEVFNNSIMEKSWFRGRDRPGHEIAFEDMLDGNIWQT